MTDFQYQTATPESATDIQIQNTLRQLHTALPAKVIHFHPTKQTVSLAVQIKQVLVDGKSIAIPPLMDVPICYPRGGGFAITFPLRAGDEGIAIFSERCIDGWWQSGNASEPLDHRFHDLSDAMFIPGICSQPQCVKNFFAAGLSLQTLSGSTFIRMVEGSITIKGDITHNGNTQQIGNTTTTGTLTGQTDVIAGGVSGKSHTHSGDSGGTTGQPK
ncbi:Gp138 family membrane-puncturing spike protein [Avibacterium paragallinarum]|uniref:Gp138 family membrane-puncturing spike protein n=1 Tax=Avibacterium paragallinarum TaxID=728 RepID=UPI00397CF971